MQITWSIRNQVGHDLTKGKQTMTNSLPVKFGIGFIAGLCAALFPRLFAELATGTESENDVLELLSFSYISLSFAFAALIGTVITIFEWEGSSSPKDIFMSALAIPAVLSGTLNTTISAQDFGQAEIDKKAYELALEKGYQIPTLSPSILVPLDEVVRSKAEEYQISFSLMNTAHADSKKTITDVGPQISNYGIGIRKMPKSYVVVIDKASSREEAETKVASLRGIIQTKQFRNNRNQIFITTNSSPQNKTNALIEAVRIKNEKGLTPSLMEVK